MLQKAPDVVDGRLAQTCVAALVCEEVLAVLPQALVHVHPRAVVHEERLGHEGRHIAVLGGYVLDDVLVDHHLVAHLREGVEAHVDLGLTRGADLVVLHLDVHAGLDQLEHDLGPQVLELVGRRHREVALLVPRPERQVGLRVLARVPDAFIRIDVVVAAEGVLVEAQGVEKVELRLRAPVAHVGDARAAQVLLGFLGDEARVPAIGLARDRVDDVADQEQGLVRKHRIDGGRVRVGDEEHVALIDGLEAADAGPVESEAAGEAVLLELAERQAEVLPCPREVDEPDVDDLDALSLRALDHLARAGLAAYFRLDCH